MESEIFKNLYAQLNPGQKEAVDTLEGPVMVVAGPGTGKTQVLTLRIANILIREKAKPEEILALTFTESGVSAMRKRLIGILGPQAYYIPIHTFHAFCNEIIRNNPDEFPQFHDKNVVDEIGRMQIMESVIQEGSFKLLKPFGDNFMYVGPLLHTFSDMKREGIGPEKLLEFVGEEARQFETMGDLYHEKGPHKGKMKGPYKDWERNIEKNKEMAALFAIYQDKLADAGYDYDDIILSTVERLSPCGRSPEGREGSLLLQKLQEQCKYLLADEHQDTNQAQNKVLELLCAHRKNPNIFVVGDEKQSIYRFQGANLANFLYFHSTFPNSKIITLAENYRSSQRILDASGSMMESSSPSLQAKSGHPEKKVRTYSFQNSSSENYFLARKIKKIIKSGMDAQEIAVLYRDNRDAFPIRDMLEKNGVPVRVESDEQLLENSDIKNLFLLVKAVSDFGSDEALTKALHANFLKIPSLDIYKLVQHRGSPLYDILRSKSRMRALGVSRAVRLNNFYKNLSLWNKMAHNKSVPQVFESIVRESGFFDYVLGKGDYIEGIDRVRFLHSLAKRLASENRNYTLNDFVERLELIGERGVSLREKKLTTRRSAVRLMTAHRAKGLEFDYVFIAGANMGHWGKRHTRQMLKPPSATTMLAPTSKSVRKQSSALNISASDKEDDERRLFYVALTRARKGVYISYPNAREDGREIFPSQFIEEIDSAHKISGNSEVYERGLERNPRIHFANRKDIRLKEDEREFLREVFEKRGLSPTALNNYIECPWKYFYNNLLQIPRAKTKHEMYGTAVHSALKELFDDLSRGHDYLLMRFESALEREPISEHDFEESLAKGKETLSRYFENYNEAWHTNTVNEFAIKNVFLDGEVRLTGKIDKIEINPSGSDPDGLKVNVVDYKTGKRKTRNELEGKTKNAMGNEKRQLVFYKLLLDKLPGSTYAMTSGEIDFVESEKNTGKFYKERFEISDDDVRDLEYKIQDVTAEILGFGFWNATCDNSKCEYCELRKNIS